MGSNSTIRRSLSSVKASANRDTRPTGGAFRIDRSRREQSNLHPHWATRNPRSSRTAAMKPDAPPSQRQRRRGPCGHESADGHGGRRCPQGEAQKLTPMPNSPFCARWCKAGVWRPPLGRGQGRWRRSADRARLGAPLQRRGGRTLILSVEDDVDESQTRHRAARGLFPLNHRCRPAT